MPTPPTSEQRSRLSQHRHRQQPERGNCRYVRSSLRLSSGAVLTQLYFAGLDRRSRDKCRQQLSLPHPGDVRAEPLGFGLRPGQWLPALDRKPVHDRRDAQRSLCSRPADGRPTAESSYYSTLFFNSWWTNALPTAPDQLRQRIAFALSEIMVVSDTGPLNNNGFCQRLIITITCSTTPSPISGPCWRKSALLQR